jgi:hypothetical protein
MRTQTLEGGTAMAINEPKLSSDWRGNRTICAALAAGIILICGGASASATPPPTYVSPGKYREYSCNQLLGAARDISGRAAALAGRKSGGDVASRDPVVAVPAALQDAGLVTGQLAGLKQDLDWVEEAAIQGQCDIEFVGSK